MSTKSICLVTPSFGAGGAERVLSSLANYFVVNKEIDVHLIILIGGDQFYDLDERIKVHRPNFYYRDYNRVLFSIKIFQFLRKKLRNLDPEATLTFGGKYNAFVLLASLGLRNKIFVSDRSRPSISYGYFIDMLNKKLYMRATGIIAQTNRAKEMMHRKTRHNNICVIPNPIRSVKINPNIKKENIILNVGRFIESKHQKWLIDYFIDLNLSNWQLYFLGEGPLFEEVKNSDKAKQNNGKIVFKGNVKDIDDYYAKAKIFAFTSLSEGFPNALGEAMSAGLASISFDCEAGPSDLINDQVNGFLIDNEDHKNYKKRMLELCTNEALREAVGKKAKVKIKDFNLKIIADKYFDFIFPTTI